MSPFQLIVGLGNPGLEYDATRHNAGAWLVKHIGDQYRATWQKEKKFRGMVARIMVATQECWLLSPSTFMNESGSAVKALSDFYKIKPESILVAHDDLDLPVGTARLKQGGGHGGHNGLRDTIEQLGSNHFSRIRIGIGHPGFRDDVHDYVLSKPSRDNKLRIEHAISDVLTLLPTIVTGNLQAAMNTLHTNNSRNQDGI